MQLLKKVSNIETHLSEIHCNPFCNKLQRLLYYSCPCFFRMYASDFKWLFSQKYLHWNVFTTKFITNFYNTGYNHRILFLIHKSEKNGWMINNMDTIWSIALEQVYFFSKNSWSTQILLFLFFSFFFLWQCSTPNLCCFLLAFFFEIWFFFLCECPFSYFFSCWYCIDILFHFFSMPLFQKWF